jgi:HD superfamily phosphodiesterase
MADMDNFLDAAGELLMGAPDGPQRLEHTQRVLRCCGLIADLPELAGRRIDRRCLQVAAIFHEVGAAGAAGAGGGEEAATRARSADLMMTAAADLLPERQLARCARILRESASRVTDLLEAQILADAINLEDLGALGVWAELRRFAAAGRPVGEALISWQRKIEYNYFQARIKDCLRLAAVRRLANKRLEAVTGFMEQLKAEHVSEDIKALSRTSGKDRS